MIFVQPRPPTLSRLTPAVVLSQSDWALTPEDCNVCVRRYEGRTGLIVIYLVIVVLIQVIIVPVYPETPGDTWRHLTSTRLINGIYGVYNVHPLMYHPNFDIKGVIINSLKLSQNLNIYFIQDQHGILKLPQPTDVSQNNTSVFLTLLPFPTGCYFQKEKDLIT